MVKEEVNPYQYLNELEGYEEEEILVPASFDQVTMGNPNYTEINGVECQKSKFCHPGFPEQNLSSFYFIPLYVNAVRRVMYAENYSGGQGGPPDCQSKDGLSPIVPLHYNGAEISKCGQCPLHGFGRTFKCHDKPLLVMLAYFADTGLLVPCRKDIPSKSIKNFNNFVQALTSPSVVNKLPSKLPIWTRVVKATVVISPDGITTWAFKVLDETNTEPGIPSFVPPHLLEEVRKFLGITTQFVNTILPNTQAQTMLTSAPEAKQLTGVTSIEVAKAEEEAVY